MTILLRSCRWGSIPPTIIPYFSTNLNPGVVFRVPAIVPFHPVSFAASRNLRDLREISTVQSRGVARHTPRLSHYTSPGYLGLLALLGGVAWLSLGLSLPWSLCLEERPILPALTIPPYHHQPSLSYVLSGTSVRAASVRKDLIKEWNSRQHTLNISPERRAKEKTNPALAPQDRLLFFLSDHKSSPIEGRCILCKPSLNIGFPRGR